MSVTSSPERKSLPPTEKHRAFSESGRTSDMHARVRQVLAHHKLCKSRDGVIEADLIEAVLASQAEAAVMRGAEPKNAYVPLLSEEKVRSARLRYEEQAQKNSIQAVQDGAGNDGHKPWQSGLISLDGSRNQKNKISPAQFQQRLIELIAQFSFLYK